MEKQEQVSCWKDVQLLQVKSGRVTDNVSLYVQGEYEIKNWDTGRENVGKDVCQIVQIM